MATIDRDPFLSLPDDTPIYRLLMAHFMDDDTLHAEDEMVAFTGEPTEHMEPLNAPARERMRAYLQKLEDCHKTYCEKSGRPYTPRVTDFAETVAMLTADAKADAAKVQIFMPERRDIPLRPDLIPPEKRKRGRPPKILASKAPPMHGKPEPKPISVMGRNYENDVGSNSTL